MSYQRFMEKMAGIYLNNFRAKEAVVVEHGLVPDPAVTNRVRAYLVAIQPEEVVLDLVAGFAQRIADVIPCIAYDEANLHTTLADQLMPAGVEWGDGQLQGMYDVVGKYCGWDLGRAIDPLCRLSYGGFLFNQTGVVLAGWPSLSFEMLAIIVREALLSEGYDFRKAWGGHMTVCRVTAPISAAETRDFLQLMKESPEIERQSLSRKVIIGYGEVTLAGFILNRFDETQA